MYADIATRALRLYEAPIGENDSGQQFMVRDANERPSRHRLFL